MHYSVDQAGVWVDCIRERRAVIHNDYFSLPHRKGFPSGHAKVIRELVTPVIRGEKIVAILGVGNKETDYDQQDVELVSSFADLAWDIAERKHMDEQIRASEERFRSFVENINDTAYTISQEGILTYVSTNVKDILGLDADELVGKSFRDVVHPEDYAICLQSIQRSFANAEKQSGVEFRIRHKNGDWRWQTSNTSPILGVDGKPVSALGVSRDITERKLIEENLRNREMQSQKKLFAITRPDGDIGDLELADIFDYETMQLLMDDFYKLTHVGIGIIDMKGRVLVAKGWQTICSQFFRRHSDTQRNCIESDIELTKGVNPGSFIGYKCKNHLWDFSTPIVLGGKHFGNIFLGQFFFEDEIPDKELFRGQAQKYGFDEEAFLEALDQVPRWSHEKVETILRFYSKLATVISTLNFSNLLLARTLTEKDQLLKQLAKSEERYRTVADFTSDWETWVDPSGRYLYCSPSCLKITGYEAEEFFQDPTLLFRIIHPDDLFFLEDHYKNQHLEHESQNITFRLITKNNNIRWIEHVCISVYGDSGDYLGKRASYRDVTQKQMVQENLEKQERILEASQRMAHVGSYLLDFEKNTVEWTKETFNIFGLGETDQPPSLEEYKLLIHPEDIQEVYDSLNKSITTGQIFDLVYRIIRPDGTLRFVHSLGTPEMNSDGVVVRLAGTLQDVTESKLIENELKSSLDEKTVLIREVHHRVKNNLAAILGLIEIERHALKDPASATVMMELGNRIKSMAVVHEQLYRSDNLSLIGFENYLNSFIPYLRLSFQSVENIDIQVIAQDIELSLDLAVPCGLIVNELLTNALKHAFPTASERSSNSEPLTISITMQNQNGHYILSVSDNGIGMPDDFNWRETQTLGLRMVRMLCEHQLGGKMELDQTNGTQFLIHFSGRRQRIENGQK
jgi:PAS domain S-box-containing protein